MDYNTWVVWNRQTGVLVLEIGHVPLKFSEKTVLPVLAQSGVCDMDLEDTEAMTLEFIETERAITAPQQITRQMMTAHRIVEWRDMFEQKPALTAPVTPGLAGGVMAALGGVEFKGGTAPRQGRPRREAIVGLLPGEIALVVRRKDGRMFNEGVDEGHDELVAWACAVDDKKKVHVMSRVMAQATADLVKEAEIEFEGATGGGNGKTA